MYELNSEKKIITILDAQTGENIRFIVKAVKTSDHIKYRSESIDVLTKRKDTMAIYDLKSKWGEQLILGIEGEYFQIDGKPISTRKEDENFYPGWFALLKDSRVDLIWKLVDYTFGENNVVMKEEQLPFVRN